MALLLTIEDKIAHIQLNRPAALNALSFATLREIDDTVARVEQEIEAGNVRGVVFTGTGEKAFCAGADITELLNRSLMEESMATKFGQGVMTRISELRVPTVAVIHGYAFGGGLELALSCTFRVATPKAKVGLPEIKLGLVPGYGGTQRLPRLVGEGRALDIIMSGRTVEADEAERIGLVTRKVDDGDPLAIGKAFLAPYLKFGLPALDLARQAVTRGMQTSLVEGLKIERDLSTLSFETEDGQEGMKAFLEKRPAQFRDR